MRMPLDRRLFLGSLLATVGLSPIVSPSWLRRLAAQDEPRTAHQNVILLWLNGGPATIDLWDLKPGHANGGPFEAIGTSSNEMKISEHLPQTARWAHRMSLIRSMSTREGDHERASHFARTGYVPQAGIDFPDLGALLTHAIDRSPGVLPNYVSVVPPRRGIRQGAGFLGPTAAPVIVGEGATSPGDLIINDIHPPSVQSKPLRQIAEAELQGLNRRFVEQNSQAVPRNYLAAAERAFQLMSPSAISAFDLEEEPDSTKSLYGNHLFGQGCLLARRLVERGVTFVEVTLDGWDTHSDNFNRVAELSTRLDQAFAALIKDLDRTGLLDSTLVVCQGEFGRTPKINANRGRDHWPRAWAIALAGGSSCRGQVIGQTSPCGTEVESDSYSTPDLIATIAHLVGVDHEGENMSNVDRPIAIADRSSRLIEGLL